MNTDPKPISSSILMEGELTEQVLGASFKVLNALGAGFLEEVYENALALELQKAGLSVECQKSFPVRYEGTVVGEEPTLHFRKFSLVFIRVHPCASVVPKDFCGGLR